jgi:uncharacterized repeat protein (TIGR01451 family)
VVAFVQANNTGTPSGSATVETVAPTGSGFVGGAACSPPVVATLQPSAGYVSSQPVGVSSTVAVDWADAAGVASVGEARLPGANGLLPGYGSEGAVALALPGEDPLRYDVQPSSTTVADYAPETGLPLAPALSGETINLSIGTLPPGKSITITFEVTVDNPFPGGSTQVCNQGIVSGSDFPDELTDDPDVGGVADPTCTDIDQAADLSITKSDSPDPVLAGNNLTYTITVSNAGPGDAQNVEVVDTLPAGTTYVSDTDSCIEAPAGTLTCSLGTIAAGGSTSFDITVEVDPSLAGGTVLTNSATVSATTTDPNAANDTATENTTVNAEADLSITKSDSPDPVVAGNDVTYTITVSNSGPSDAENVQVVDTLPAGTTFVSDTDSCVEAPAGTLTCSLGAIATGGSTSFDITVAVDPSVADGAVLTNSSTLSTTTTDPNAANDTATENTTVNAEADLSITKSDSPDPVVAGDNVTYTISVSNSGPSDAQNVQVVDTLPAGTTFVSQTDSCVEAPAGTLTCSLGAIAAGGSTSFDTTVTVDRWPLTPPIPTPATTRPLRAPRSLRRRTWPSRRTMATLHPVPVRRFSIRSRSSTTETRMRPGCW